VTATATAPRGRRALAACCAAIAVVLGACSGDGDGATDGPTSTTAAPVSTAVETTVTTLPEGATEQGLRELEVGDCFDLVDDPAAADRAVWSLPCEDPHSHEVYDVLDYEGEDDENGGDGSYPGVPIVQDWAEQACHDRFEAFVGVRWTLSELDIQVWWPSEDSWASGDRTVICTVFSPSRDRLHGSQRGTGR